jgi:quercetin dioxygenase-like cupin family protein
MKVSASSDVPKKPVELDGAKGVEMRVLIGKDDGAQTFFMRMFELQPGGHTPLHAHPHEHEVFVLEGEGVVTFEGKEHRLEPEHVVFVPGQVEHNFENTGDSTFRFLCLIPASAG